MGLAAADGKACIAAQKSFGDSQSETSRAPDGEVAFDGCR